MSQKDKCEMAQAMGLKITRNCIECGERYCSVLGSIVAGETVRELGKRESNFTELHTRLDRQFPDMGWRV